MVLGNYRLSAVGSQRRPTSTPWSDRVALELAVGEVTLQQKSSDDELVGNPSGNRSPSDPSRFFQALQDMDSRSQHGLANATMAAGSIRAPPNSEVCR